MEQALLFAILVVFPVGQLWGHLPLDILVGAAAFYGILANRKRALVFGIFAPFVLAAVFSYFLSVGVIKNPDLIKGGLYLWRLVAFWFFGDWIVNLVKKKPELKDLIAKSLIAMGVITALFGWWQYWRYPDLTALKYLGWDDHLYRLVGTFLDPGFTALFLVFGAVLSFGTGWILPLFFTVSLAFTYSRAGYLAFWAAMLALAFLRQKEKAFLLAIALVAAICFLPHPAGEGVNLARTYSVVSRGENYLQTLAMALKTPVFGVGYNNLCIYKGGLGGHACSGADASLLLILATTGLVGLTLFIRAVFRLGQRFKKGPYFIPLVASAVALATHSLLVNSLLYPFTVVFFSLLLSLQTFKEKN